MKVCGEAGDGPELVEQVEKHRPQVLLLDVTLPGLAGLEILARIGAEHPDTRAVVLGPGTDAELVRSAVVAGADAYLPKSAAPGDVVAAVRAVAGGGGWLHPAAAGELFRHLRASRRRRPELLARLSAREVEVLRLIAEGSSAKEVASALGISTKTVEAHRTSLMRKLGVRKATELVRCALRCGLIDP